MQKQKKKNKNLLITLGKELTKKFKKKRYVIYENIN